MAETPAVEPTATPEQAATALFPELKSEAKRANFLPSLTSVQSRVEGWVASLGTFGRIRVAAGWLGLFAIALALKFTPLTTVSARMAIIVAAACLLAAGFAATAVRYLTELAPDVLPEAPGLARGARVMVWLLVFAAISVGLEWGGRFTVLRMIHFLFVGVNVALCWSLLERPQALDSAQPVFPVDFGPLSVLGGRANIFASILDSAERQLGIDLRSTWALTVVRHGLEPLVIALFLLAWLSTSLTVVGVEEQGLVERLGVPRRTAPLLPGLRMHWPWPIDRVYRIPVARVQALQVGHEGEEAEGPESVLWSVEHAPNEFTLVLGNGRDLITVDAAVQYRIVDPRAWRYACQNPADALHALAYRAVMRNTVNRTLSEALSENVATLTERMRAMVQADADALGLGVRIIGFTVGGMHPPVAVAPAYEAVVSAQITKVTTVVNAQAVRNQTLPAAQAAVLVATNGARAEGAETLARAAGEAWSFRALEAQFRSAPADYFFRRRLETLEKDLAGHPFTVLDARIMRDGGELWLIP